MIPFDNKKLSFFAYTEGSFISLSSNPSRMSNHCTPVLTPQSHRCMLIISRCHTPYSYENTLSVWKLLTRSYDWSKEVPLMVIFCKFCRSLQREVVDWVVLSESSLFCLRIVWLDNAATVCMATLRSQAKPMLYSSHSHCPMLISTEQCEVNQLPVYWINSRCKSLAKLLMLVKLPIPYFTDFKKWYEKIVRQFKWVEWRCFHVSVFGLPLHRVQFQIQWERVNQEQSKFRYNRERAASYNSFSKEVDWRLRIAWKKL